MTIELSVVGWRLIFKKNFDKIFFLISKHILKLLVTKMSDDENNTSYGVISEPQIADQSVGSSISTSMQVNS